MTQETTKMTSLKEVEAVLAEYVPVTRQITGRDLTLGRTRQLLQVLGNPHEKLKVIHIAGTSGKTSTAYYITNLLTQAGKKVGLTVSPHVDSVTERIQVNGAQLSVEEFCRAFSEFLPQLEAAGIKPSYFEVLICFAFWYFARQQVDYAVIETGLGGLQDATNIAERAEKVCVITDIGFDHMHVLGHTLSEIAQQKAGIIHPGNIAITYKQSAEVMGVLQTWTREQGAKLEVVDEDEERKRVGSTTLNELPIYQQRNWLLAQHVYVYLSSRDKLPELSAAQLATGMSVQVPGRMDIRQVEHKTVIMDGAHNGQKMQAFITSFRAKYPGRQAAILLSLKEGKEYQAVLPLLKPICSKLIITNFSRAQDVPTPSIEPSILANAALALGFSDVSTEPDNTAAYRLLINQPSDLVIITGSFYLLSNLRPFIKEHA